MILLKIIINFANLASQTTTRNKLAPPLRVNYFSIPRFVLRSTHLLSFFFLPEFMEQRFRKRQKSDSGNPEKGEGWQGGRKIFQ